MPISTGRERAPRTLLAGALLAATLVAAGPGPASLAQVPQGVPAAEMPAIGSPRFGPDGTVVFAAAGDLWLAPAGPNGPVFDADSLVQLTRGPAWDRDPTWMPDGRAVVFASDRSGSTDLWEVAMPAGSEPRRLTTSALADTEPAAASDGRIVFVRGSGPLADLWLLETDGTERQVTNTPGAELSPSPGPDGTRIVYVQDGPGGRGLRVRALEPLLEAPEAEAEAEPEAEVPAPGSASVVVEGSVAEPSFSPDGRMIVYSDFGSGPEVRVADPEGLWSLLVASRRAEAAWSGDGTLLLAEAARPGPGYNGDPDRLGDRRVGDSLAREGRLWWIPAPRPPGDGEREVLVPLPAADRNAEAFDRVFARVRGLYGAGNPEAWDRLGERLRPQALTASSEADLEDVIHELLTQRPPARSEVSGRAAVSSAHALASAAGVEILEAGGNVVDAAVAVSFALGVVEPDASGIGGYGEMLVYLRGMERPTVIEFLTRVPEAAGLDNAALIGSRVPSHGPVLVNVPGTVRGMELAWKRYGSGELEWSRLLEPAVTLARDGFVLDDAFTTTLAREREGFLESEAAAELFFPDGEPLRAGDTYRNPGLAEALAAIAAGGADAFYEGAIAHRIVRDLRGQGNAMTLTDMARYFAAERPPVEGTYRGQRVFSAAPAVSGGASLVARLHLLDNAGFGDGDLSFVQNADALHAMIEAWKLAPSLNGLVADPGLWPVDLEPALDRSAATARWNACFDPERASGPEQLRQAAKGPPARPACLENQAPVAAAWGEELRDCDGEPGGCRSTGTTSFAVADAAGNMVSVTQTLGTWGGNFYVTPGLGFLYNDKLRSYSSDPGAYNARLPYARNSTGIAPTLLFREVDGTHEPWVAYGAAGNAWISSAVYQMTSGFVDAGLGPQAALELPRFLVGVRRSPRDRDEVEEIVVQMEDALAPEVLRELRARGHLLQAISLRGELRMGYGAAVMIRDGRVRAGADPRRSGAAAALAGEVTPRR